MEEVPRAELELLVDYVDEAERVLANVREAIASYSSDDPVVAELRHILHVLVHFLGKLRGVLTDASTPPA